MKNRHPQKIDFANFDSQLAQRVRTRMAERRKGITTIESTLHVVTAWAEAMILLGFVVLMIGICGGFAA